MIELNNPTPNEVVKAIKQLDNEKVEKVNGKGLSSNDFTDIYKEKLNGIKENAEVNVQSDWNETNTSSDAYIKNKPAIPTALSQLTQDANYRTVTDVEKTTWNNKADETAIPTVGNGTITIKQGETVKGSFSTNQSENATITLNDGGGLPLGILIPSTVVQDDAGLHLADGTSYSQDGIYSQFATWLKEKYPSGDYTQAQFDSDVATYGQCGHYVIDNDNNTFRFPLITEFVASNNGGQAIGLAQLDEFKSHSHNFSVYRGGNLWNSIPAGMDWNNVAGSNVTTNNTGGSETRPKNIRYPYYIVVATGVKTPVEVNIDKVVTDLNTINATLEKTEKIEVIYDMTSSDPDINWGYTAGIQAENTAISGKNFNKYKFLIITAKQGIAGMTSIMDLTILNTSSNTYNSGALGCESVNTDYCKFTVNANKTEFTCNRIGYRNSSGGIVDMKSENAICMKIQGVY